MNPTYDQIIEFIDDITGDMDNKQVLEIYQEIGSEMNIRVELLKEEIG